MAAENWSSNSQKFQKIVDINYILLMIWLIVESRKKPFNIGFWNIRLMKSGSVVTYCEASWNQLSILSYSSRFLVKEIIDVFKSTLRIVLRITVVLLTEMNSMRSARNANLKKNRINRIIILRNDLSLLWVGERQPQLRLATSKASIPGKLLSFVGLLTLTNCSTFHR